jgi:hypothetical protein
LKYYGYSCHPKGDAPKRLSAERWTKSTSFCYWQLFGFITVRVPERPGTAGEVVKLELMPTTPAKAAASPTPPVSKWAPAVLLGWLIPGGGHFLLKRTGRGALLLVSVLSMFLLGLMMRGAMFQPQTGDILTTIIYCGGFLGDLAAGLLYLLTTWLGYAQIDMAGHVHDYGTKFLVAAGLMNVLAMVDAYEIATGKKD